MKKLIINKTTNRVENVVRVDPQKGLSLTDSNLELIDFIPSAGPGDSVVEGSLVKAIRPDTKEVTPHAIRGKAERLIRATYSIQEQLDLMRGGPSFGLSEMGAYIDDVRAHEGEVHKTLPADYRDGKYWPATPLNRALRVKGGVNAK